MVFLVDEQSEQAAEVEVKLGFDGHGFHEV
jgi:hypothetical protein